MIIDCLRVRHRIQGRLDRGEGALTDRDALHLQSCARCGGLLRGYSLFGRELRRQAGIAVAESGVPRWDGIFAAARVPAGSAAVPAAARANGARSRHAHPFGGGVARRLPAWTSTVAARAALLAVVLCLGALFGYREYRAAAARSFVRSSTTEFVDAIFASSIFSASPPAAPSQGTAADAAWFDATSPSAQLPLPPVSAGARQTPPTP